MYRQVAEKRRENRFVIRACGLLHLPDMITHRLVPSAAVTILLSTLPAGAAELSPSIRSSAACAPVGLAVPSQAPIVLALESERMLYNAGERVAISAGTKQGVEIGQKFFVRRPLGIDGELRGEHTAGWLRVVETRQSSATAVVEFSCDALPIGDHLEPFVDESLPGEIDRKNASGTLYFTKSATVLFGNDGRQLAGGRDFVLSDAGQKHGVTP